MLIRITRLTEIYLEHTYVVKEINEQAQAMYIYRVYHTEMDETKWQNQQQSHQSSHNSNFQCSFSVSKMIQIFLKNVALEVEFRLCHIHVLCIKLSY